MKDTERMSVFGVGALMGFSATVMANYMHRWPAMHRPWYHLALSLTGGFAAVKPSWMIEEVIQDAKFQRRVREERDRLVMEERSQAAS